MEEKAKRFFKRKLSMSSTERYKKIKPSPQGRNCGSDKWLMKSLLTTTLQTGHWVFIRKEAKNRIKKKASSHVENNPTFNSIDTTLTLFIFFWKCIPTSITFFYIDRHTSRNPTGNELQNNRIPPNSPSENIRDKTNAWQRQVSYVREISHRNRFTF